MQVQLLVKETNKKYVMKVEFAFKFAVKEGDRMEVTGMADETTHAMIAIGEALKQIYARLMANERDVG